jgi:hypothetical protein
MAVSMKIFGPVTSWGGVFKAGISPGDINGIEENMEVGAGAGIYV